MNTSKPRTEIVARLTERLSAVRLSANEASERAGLSVSYANDILAGRSRNPGRRKLSLLAKELGCSVGYLLGEEGASPDARRAIPWKARAGSIHRTLPPDEDGFFTVCSATSGPIPFLPDTPGAYAIVVPDRTMEPRYDAGSYVVGAPAEQVQNGGFALVIRNDGRALVRRVDVMLPELVRLSRLDGIGQRDIPRDRISAVHRIVSAGEMP